MATDEQIDGLIDNLKQLTEALPAARTLGDVLAVKLLATQACLQFSTECSGQVTTSQVGRLLDARAEFARQSHPKIMAGVNRPGFSPTFSRSAFGRRTAEVQGLPRGLRAALARLPDPALREIAYLNERVADSLIDVSFLASFDMTPPAAASLLQFNLANFVISHPQVLQSLPPVVKAQLHSGALPQRWISRSHSLFSEVANTQEAVIIDIAQAQGINRIDTLRWISEAVDTRSTQTLRRAIQTLKKPLYFFTTDEVHDLPSSDFDHFDGKLSMAAIVRHARRGKILYDSERYALIESDVQPSRRYFIRFPTHSAVFAEAGTEESAAAYHAAPLAFVLKHYRQRKKSVECSLLRSDIDRLEGFKRELAVAATAVRFSEEFAHFARAGVASIPSAGFAAAAYFVVCRQLGLQDASTVAALEGIVHLILSTIAKVGKGAIR